MDNEMEDKSRSIWYILHNNHDAVVRLVTSSDMAAINEWGLGGTAKFVVDNLEGHDRDIAIMSRKYDPDVYRLIQELAKRVGSKYGLIRLEYGEDNDGN